MSTTEKKRIVAEKRIPNRVHRLTMTLNFEHGLAAGEGTFGNEMLLARNGKNELVLRGTAIAGVLRSAWRKYYDDENENHTDKYFGYSCDENDLPSALVVPDCVIKQEDSGEFRRTHHLRCRHRGSVLDGGLYSIEMVSPKSKVELTLWMNETDSQSDGYDVLQKIAGLARQGLIFGGNSNRGVGLATAEEFHYGNYDFTQSENKASEYARYLKDHYQWREDGKISNETKPDLPFDIKSPAKWQEKNLKVKFSLTIPRGQDLLVSQGSDDSGNAEPHRIKGADGKDYWLIPGSTLHGLFRDWVNRLAAREGRNIADSYENYEKNPDRTGEDIAWLFMKGQERKKYMKSPEILQNDYPIDYLFGSLYRAGRVHISDAIAPVTTPEKSTEKLAMESDMESDSEVQKRVHVAIDAISGGAIEHLLFENYVLVGNAKKPTFQFTMVVRDIREDEANWLAKTLIAIDLGLLRIGSSKSSGRLALVESPEAKGRFEEKFTKIQPLEKNQ